MPDNQQVQPKPQEKKGFFEKMNLFQKILLFIFALIVLFTVVGILFGGIGDFYQFFFYMTVFVGVVVGAYIIIKAVNIIYAPRFYSPREDLRTKILNMATDYKPDNVTSLYFTGDVGKKRVLAGRITGLLGLPYYTGEVQRYDKDVVDAETRKVLHKKGDVIYTEAKDFSGKRIPRYKDIRFINDGDTLFVVKKGLIFVKTHLIRCHRDLHSTLNGDVEIYDINPQPYGFFEYPYKQMQKNVTQIMVQNQIETILATHEHQHDLISQSVDSAIYFNPVYRYTMKAGTEIPEQ